MTACGGTSGGQPAHRVTLGLAFVPNIQFAPFYVALSQGYFKDAGLDVSLRHHGFTEDEFGAIASGKEDVLLAGGDEMMQASDHAIDLVDVAQLFRKYPVGVMAPVDSSIRTPSDLRGKTVGTPGPFGETYFGFLALLQGAGLSASDVNMQYIQFTQVAALTGRKVDAVVGYLNNEAIQLDKAHFPVRTFALSEVVKPLPLVSNGLGALRSTLTKRPGDVRGIVAATLRGYAYTIAHPQQAVDMSKKYVPGLEDPTKAADAMAVLQATIPMWQESGVQPGFHDAPTWQAMATFMRASKLMTGTRAATAAYSNDYLPGR